MTELSKGYRIMVAIRELKTLMKEKMEKHYAEMNLTGPQSMVVGILGHHGEMKISDLSEKLGFTNSTVSGIIDRLETQEMVQRIRSKEDRRVVYVNLTPEFREKAKKFFKGMEWMFSDTINNATPEELDKILVGLETLEKLLKKGVEKKE